MAPYIYSVRPFLIPPEEETIINNIVPKDAPVGHNVEVNSIMGVIEDIFLNSFIKYSMVSQDIRNSFGARKDPAPRIELNETIRHTIHRLSWEIKCKCSKGLDEPTITQNIFKLLEKFNWEEKAVLVLAAFAMSYGEFWLTIPPIAENPLSLSLSMFKQHPCLRGSSSALKSRFEAQANLIKSTLDLANCMVDLKDYFSKIQSIFPIRVACYRIVMSVVLCLFYNMELAKMGTEYTGSDTEIPELNARNKELQTILAYLKELKKFYEYEIFSASFEDISIKIGIFFAEREESVLWRHSFDETRRTASEVGLDAVKGRSVAFFVADFDFDVNMQEFKILVQTHKKIKEGEHKDKFEIVWIPMDNQSIPDSDMKTITRDRATKMPWLSFCHPTTIKTSFRSYIRESWHFQKKPILVVMDRKGTVTCTNAIPMVTIWGVSAYPFTSSMEAILWQEEEWNVEDLVEHIDSQITTIKQEKLVCLYGGDDWDWIKKFVQTMKTVMGKAQVPMELIYIGINGRREKMQKIITAFKKEAISKCWTEDMIRWFWFRFQSMYNSRMQCRTFSSLVQDNQMEKLTKISTFASGDYGWAMMMFKRSHPTVVASEKQIMGFLDRSDNWRPKLRTPADILLVAEDDMTKNRSYKHCTHTTIPVNARPGMEIERCLECGSIMEMYYLYKCCTE